MHSVDPEARAVEATGSEVAHTPTVSCAHCAETILSDAKICRFCQRKIAARSAGNIGRTVGIIAAASVTLMALFLIYGATLNHGIYTRLYAANELYGAKITPDQADQLVDKIVETVSTDTGRTINLSRRDAEDIAIAFSRGQIDQNLWIKATAFSIEMVRFAPKEFSSSDMTTNLKQAAEALSSAFADPAMAANIMAPFGLLNATQSEQVTQLAAQGDNDAAKRVLASALNSFE